MFRAEEDDPPPAKPDVVSLITPRLPYHVLVTLGAIIVMLVAGLWFARHVPPRPDISTTSGVKTEILEGRVALVQPSSGPGQATRVFVDITRGNQAEHRVEIQQSGDATGMVGNKPVRVGDEVFVMHISSGALGEQFVIQDFVRLPALLLVLAAFAVATIVIGRWVGLRALISIGISVLAVFVFILPGIAAGKDPLLVCLLGSLLMMTASLYLTFGWNWKTHVSAFSMGLSLLAAALLSIVAARLSNLTGFSTDESAMLVQSAQIPIDMQGLFMGGVLVGAAGILGDAVVSQASAAFELKSANHALDWRQLYRHTMAIGRDHIASMVNVLLLAYASASLPLLLLLGMQALSFTQTLNSELIAEEFVRTLIGSLGLILAVPITSLVASLVAARLATTDGVPVEAGA
jgi:uncharacterized membrane protein